MQTPLSSSPAGPSNQLDRMFDQLVQFISEKYPRAAKIVEVGVGHRIDIARKVKENLPPTEVLVTDNDEEWVHQHNTVRVRAVVDDVMFPHLPIYQRASLIYSIHPPVEVLTALEELSRTVGADLLVVPISDEQEALYAEKWQRIIRNGRVVGWLLAKG